MLLMGKLIQKHYSNIRQRCEQVPRWIPLVRFEYLIYIVSFSNMNNFIYVRVCASVCACVRLFLHARASVRVCFRLHVAYVFGLCVQYMRI